MAEVFVNNAMLLRNGELSGPHGCIRLDSDSEPQILANPSNSGIDGKGAIVGPALFALWVDFKEPARDDVYSFREGMAALRVGGFAGALLESPSNPVTDGETLASLRQHCKDPRLDLRFLGSIAPGNSSDGLSGMLELHDSGIVGFGDADRDHGDARHLRSVMEYAAMTGLRVFLLPLNRSLSKKALVHECPAADIIGMRGIPVEAETIAVFQALEIARLVGCPLHLKQMTSAAALKLVRQAKATGQDVTCDASVHHLLHDCSFLPDDLDTVFHVMPPLRAPEDRAALWTGLADGTIDCVSMAHKPVLPQDKLEDFEQSTAGILSLETAFSTLATEAASRLPGGLAQLWTLLSTNPAKLAGTKPRGWILYRPDHQWTPDITSFGGRVCNSPWLGKVLLGKTSQLT